MNNNDKSFEKFSGLLKDIFQLKDSDLNFGIYKLLKNKKAQIEEFISKKLREDVDKAFSESKSTAKEELDKKIKEKEEELLKTLGVSWKDYLQSEELNKPPIIKEYEDLINDKKEIENVEQAKNQVFNDLYDFFSSFYENGDFIPKSYFSMRTSRYAIPYNGEEVTLYWATKDEYYVKTGVWFNNYSFEDEGYTFNFIIERAEQEKGSNKELKERYFLIDGANTIYYLDTNKTVKINFQYRELTDKEYIELTNEEGANLSVKINQDKVNTLLNYEKIINTLKQKEMHDIINILQKPILQENEEENAEKQDLLLSHLNKFTSKNKKDFFIHKNLRDFLSKQLQYFIKDRVLSYESILTGEDSALKEESLKRNLIIAQIEEKIAMKVIDFLAQIEDFQKKLWEKKKFVYNVNYVITLDKIKKYAGEEFLKSILKKVLDNEKQKEEWKELFRIEVMNDNDLKDGEELKKLPIDTKYFDENFKWNLLIALTKDNELDDILDGWLIHSENWQALNTILSKFKERVQTVYIDPPFNTGKDFIFKDNYQDSTWITILENRLELAEKLLKREGTIYLHLDHIAEHYGKLLLDEIFGKSNFQAKITWNTGENISGLKTQAMNWIRQADFIHFYSKNSDFKFIKVYELIDKTTRSYGWLDVLGYDDKERLFIELWKNGKFIREKISSIKVKPKGTVWNDIYSFQYSEPRITESIAFASNQKPENLLRRIVQSTSDPKDIVLDFFLGSGTTTAVAHKLNRKWVGVEMGDFFSETYIDEVEVKREQLEAINKEAIISVVRNKKNSEILKVKKLGLLGRMKIVLYGDKKFSAIYSKQKRSPHLSKDINWQGSGFFKYFDLEQYEDTLNNLEYKENQKLLENEEYLLKYWVDYETKESPSLLNIDILSDPFNYKLKVSKSDVSSPEETTIEVIETFNLLLGVKVKKVREFNEEGNKYIFVLGDRDNETCLIVWRRYNTNWTEEDFKKDKNFINKKVEQEFNNEKISRLYINGQSIITNKLGNQTVSVHYIEPEFKDLMFHAG